MKQKILKKLPIFAGITTPEGVMPINGNAAKIYSEESSHHPRVVSKKYSKKQIFSKKR